MNVFADPSTEIALSSDDDNLDGIDLDQLFNDFDEKQSYPSVEEKPNKPQRHVHCVSRLPPAKYDETTSARNEIIEFDERDCRSPIKFRKANKKKTANKKQTTMYDYAESISYKNRQFYSSLDNSTTTKIIVKAQKRPLQEWQQSTPLAKKLKIIDKHTPSSSPPPDFIDNLLRYLDDRSHSTLAHPVQQRDDQKKKKSNSMSLFNRV